MYDKVYINGKNTDKLFKSLKAAHQADRSAYVYRVWINKQTGERTQTTILAYGEQICSVKSADEEIEHILSNR